MSRAEFFVSLKTLAIMLGILGGLALAWATVAWDHEIAIAGGGMVLTAVCGFATLTRIEENNDVR